MPQNSEVIRVLRRAIEAQQKIVQAAREVSHEIKADQAAEAEAEEGSPTRPRR